MGQMSSTLCGATVALSFRWRLAVTLPVQLFKKEWESIGH